jgi:hypothetical protein
VHRHRYSVIPHFGPKTEARYRKLHDRIVGRDA